MRAILLPVVALMLFVGCATVPTIQQTQQDGQDHRHNRFDIRQARTSLIGKTPEQVVRAVGSPDRQAGGGNWEWWMYENRFQDIITQRTINVVTFVFRDGVLLDITY